MMNTQSSPVYKVDEVLLQRRPPRLTLAATLVALCKQVESGRLKPCFVVDILNENRLLPYIITHTNNIFDVSLGRNTNASKVGDIIVSEECIRGTYELCIAFLELVLATIKNSDYKDTTKVMLASLTYICNEIYTSHHIWTYKNLGDMERILCLCTEILYRIISSVKGSSDAKDLTELQIVCILNLSQNQAHKQLLDVIVNGKSSIKKKIDELKKVDDSSLRKTPIVMCIRQSLQIFNKLLTYSKFAKIFCSTETSKQQSNISQYQHGASSSPMTNIERALFDTSMRPGLLQNLFSFIYQKEDSPTACLSADLIKHIAKKFSMSLMACLGSEGDKVCEFFIGSLSDKDTNIDLEIAILDLLSSCVKHQPGLIELFLNFKPESNEKDSAGSLKVVVGRLKDCRGLEDDPHKLLHSYLMKFILTFWQKHHSAIEQFDKADEFWESITHPLVKFLEERGRVSATDGHLANINYDRAQALKDKLNSYALMILARELFSLNSGITERKMSPKLHSSLDDLFKKNFIGKYSTYVRKRYETIPSNLDKCDDYKKVLVAWRDFLTSYAKYKPFEISSDIQNQVLRDIMACMSIELNLDEKIDRERIATSGETLLLAWSKWVPNIISNDEVLASIHSLLYLIDSCKERLPFSFLLTFQSTLNLYLVKYREQLYKSERTFDLLVPSLQLMQFSLQVMESDINLKKVPDCDYKPGVESRLCQASIMTLRFIIDISRRDVNLWISYMQTNLKTDTLIQFLSSLMNRRVGSEICLSLVELLLCLSSIREAADYLNKAALLDQVNMIAVSAYERPYAHLSQLANSSMNTKMRTNDKTQQSNEKNTLDTPMEVCSAANNTTTPSSPVISDTTKIYLDNINSDHKWLPIYWHTIRLNISMMITLSKDYMTAAVEFMSIHCIRMCEVIELLRTKPRSVNMEEALQMIYMIDLVLRHGCMWKKRNPQSYDAISDEIGKTAYTLATSALPPPTAPGTSTEPNGQSSSATTGQSNHTSIKPRDCLVYARCCYDFGKYTEAERVLFQTKFGDKTGFIQEAAQIYGEELSVFAFHLASLICMKTNRQQDSIDFALEVFNDDPKYDNMVSVLKQNRSQSYM